MDSEQDSVIFDVGNSLSIEFNARRPSVEEIRERGRQWLVANKNALCKLVRDARVQAILKGSDSSQEVQIRLLVDVIASLAFGVPPTVIAKAIVVLGEA